MECGLAAAAGERVDIAGDDAFATPRSSVMLNDSALAAVSG